MPLHHPDICAETVTRQRARRSWLSLQIPVVRVCINGQACLSRMSMQWYITAKPSRQVQHHTTSLVKQHALKPAVSSAQISCLLHCHAHSSIRTPAQQQPYRPAIYRVRLPRLLHLALHKSTLPHTNAASAFQVSGDHQAPGPHLSLDK